MLPRLSFLHANKVEEQTIKNTFNKSYELVISSTIAISLGLAAIAPTFVPVFFGLKFKPCVELVEMFSVALVCKAISGCVSNQHLIPTGREKIYIQAVVVGAVLNFISNYFLIRLFEAKGAVIGTIIAEFAVMAMVLYNSKQELELRKMMKTTAIYTLFGAIMFFAVRIVSNNENYSIPNLAFKIIVGAVVYIILLCVASLINKDSVYAGIINKDLKLLRKKSDND